MKQIALLLFAVSLIATGAVAQTDSIPKKKKRDWNITNRANDHFMVQVAYDGWASMPDSIKTTGFSRSLNFYLMMDFPFKSDPRFSAAIGIGIGSSGIKFDKTEPNIISTASTLPFTNRADTTHFKKFKLVSTYAEVPVELRFITNPENSDASWKIAIGVKLGALLDVHTRGKTLVNSAGNTLNNYSEKVKSKNFFSGTRLAGTARIGYGHISLYGQYAITGFIKDGRGPNVHPYSIGLTFSGL